jgi:hypothetical protein
MPAMALTASQKRRLQKLQTMRVSIDRSKENLQA